MIDGNNVLDMKDSKLSKSIKQFLIQKRQRNENTYKNYLRDIEYFFDSIFGKPYEFVSVSEFNTEKTELDSLMSHFDNLFNLKDSNGKRVFSNNTINRKQACIKTLLKFLKIKKVYYQDLSELEAIKNLPKDTKGIEVINHDIAMQYAEWVRINEKNKAEEKHLIIKLAVDTGLRATELLTLKWSQFVVDSDYVVMTGIGKGNKPWMDKISVNFYNDLLTLRGESDKVFSLSYDNLVRMMNRIKKAYDIADDALSFHSFKKCAVNSAYRLTGDILEAQRKARHESLDTTKLYVKVEDYGMTGLVSLGGSVPNDLYKSTDKRTLIKAINSMNKDFQFILNYKLHELEKNK